MPDLAATGATRAKVVEPMAAAADQGRVDLVVALLGLEESSLAQQRLQLEVKGGL